MNGLSWLLYFAAVAPQVATTLITLGVFILIFWFVRAAGAGSPSYPFQGVTEGRVSPRYGIPIFAIILFFIAALTPPTETIYLIAGSEAGEAVVTSESGQEILNDIQEVIKHQLGELKGEKK